MNDLPLQPLVWTTESDTPSAKSPLHYYDIIREYSCGESCFVRYQKVEAGCNIKQATGFSSFDEAKTWAWNHYNKKMQPYVKPMPTWIDASERLPEDDGKYLVATSCGKQWMGNYNLPPKPNEWMLNGWSMNGGWHPFDITHWMPIPEFSTMQNLHKGE